MSYTTITELFSGICDAIRAKDGTTDPINHQDIPARIAAIQAGGGSSVSSTPPLPDPIVWVDVGSYVSGANVWDNKGTLTDAVNVKGVSINDAGDALLIQTSGAVCCNFSETYNDFTMYSVIRCPYRFDADADYPMLGADGTADNYVKLAFVSNSATSIKMIIRSYTAELGCYDYVNNYAILAMTCKSGTQYAYINGCPLLKQTRGENFGIRNICHKCAYTSDDPIAKVGKNNYYVKATLAYNAAHTFDEVVAMSDWLKAKYLAG